MLGRIVSSKTHQTNRGTQLITQIHLLSGEILSKNTWDT